MRYSNGFRLARSFIVYLFVVANFGVSLAAQPNTHDNLLLGNPSTATEDASNKNNYLMTKDYFVLSYNDSHGEPNWVSWELTKDDLGSAARKRTFATDTTLPEGFTRITTGEYAKTGFDRGHMCPHSDRAHNLAMSYSTFIMTNIIPQAPNVNRKAWDQLENYCRELVAKDQNHLYIISGPVGKGGRGSEDFETTIAAGKVVVPAMCWKIIVVVPIEGEQEDIKKINADTRVIAVLMPNDNSVGEEWSQYRTSVAKIEELTKFHFFDNLPHNVASAIKDGVDDETIPAPVTIRHGD